MPSSSSGSHWSKRGSSGVWIRTLSLGSVPGKSGLAAIALLFEYAPRRRQPEASWLAFGAAASALLWLVFMGVLVVYLEATNSFGATYGPIAGTIGVLLWTFLSAVALFGGLSVAAQLEAVRAGVTNPRVEGEDDV